MRIGWIAWIVATAACASYALAGCVSSSTRSAKIELKPGNAVSITVFRIFEHEVRGTLSFEGDHRKRPELGEWTSSNDWRTTGTLRFDNPGAEVRIKASSGDAVPILFEAMPKSSYSQTDIGRNLTPNLSLETGVWRWPPPDEPRLRLAAGFTTVRFEVVSVDPRLNAELVMLHVLPPLGFKSSQSEYSWLWLWFAWPLMLLLLALWAGVLILVYRRLPPPDTSVKGQASR